MCDLVSLALAIWVSAVLFKDIVGIRLLLENNGKYDIDVSLGSILFYRSLKFSQSFPLGFLKGGNHFPNSIH